MFAGSSPITFTSPSSEACQKSGSFAPPALPSLDAHTTLSDSRHGRRLKTTLRPLPSPMMGLPRLPEPPFRRAVPTTPADRAGARVDCFPAHAAFPKWQEGRHPHCHFRGLHRLHSVMARRIAQPPKVTFVTRLRPSQLPDQAARQLPDLSTIIRVESSSTGVSRLRGALPRSDLSSCSNECPGRDVCGFSKYGNDFEAKVAIRNGQAGFRRPLYETTRLSRTLE